MGACGQAAPWMWIARDSRRGDFFRIDPLFTMSDNARASKRRPRPIDTTNAKDFPCGRAQSLLVEPDGIEPTTSCLQSRRSPN
jgi:hypothetical protein